MKRFLVMALVLAVLFSSVNALAVDGSRLSVQMVDKSAYLQLVSSKRCTFQCKYYNGNRSKTVAGFDLAYMALDRNQDVSMQETTQYIDLRIAPLSTKASPVIYITNQRELAYLIIAVQTVYFTDGTSETIDFANGEDYYPAYFRVI